MACAVFAHLRVYVGLEVVILSGQLVLFFWVVFGGATNCPAAEGVEVYAADSVLACCAFVDDDDEGSAFFRWEGRDFR